MLEAITQGFLYPNEIEVHWSLLIVLYPYITGLVAGAFIVSSLYHVFGREELKPVARFALIAAFCFLLFACTPLLFHLGHPERAFNIMFTPKFTSAMSGFGYIYTFYLIIVALELWFVFRPDVIRLARESSGLKKAFYSVLALGAFDVSEKTLHLDHKITTVLAAIGIPSACVLHGYVGFLFGSLKSNPWWSTPLMPIIFLMSAIVSGIAILIVSYAVVMKLKGKTVDNNCMQSLCSYLWGFFIIDVTLELLELLTMAYEGEESWGILSQLIGGKLQLSYVALQFIVCSTIPLVLLGIVSLMKLKESTRNTLGIISAALLLIQVLAMRWNVVIGGQLFSKSLLGFTSYFPSLLGREGLLVALILFAMPFVCMYIANIIVPYWKEE
jgi:Ni/Fe-hydrogenase subunit HybB-like protein